MIKRFAFVPYGPSYLRAIKERYGTNIRAGFMYVAYSEIKARKMNIRYNMEMNTENIGIRKERYFLIQFMDWISL